MKVICWSIRNVLCDDDDRNGVNDGKDRYNIRVREVLVV